MNVDDILPNCSQLIRSIYNGLGIHRLEVVPLNMDISRFELQQSCRVEAPVSVYFTGFLVTLLKRSFMWNTTSSRLEKVKCSEELFEALIQEKYIQLVGLCTSKKVQDVFASKSLPTSWFQPHITHLGKKCWSGELQRASPQMQLVVWVDGQPKIFQQTQVVKILTIQAPQNFLWILSMGSLAKKKTVTTIKDQAREDNTLSSQV